MELAPLVQTRGRDRAVLTFVPVARSEAYTAVSASRSSLGNKFMAHTKAGGTTKLGRDSQPKYLGVKLYAGEPAKAGSIIIRQRGTRFVAGDGVRRGGDDTLYAIRQGTIKFTTIRKQNFDGTKKHVKKVSVL